MKSLSAFDDVTLEATGTVALLRLNEAKTMNSISSRMMAGLGQALDSIGDPASGFRAAVLTGEGRGFCSGANLTTTGPDDMLRQDNLGAVLKRVHYPVLKRMREMRMPLVVAVNGPAVGFGLSIALMGDVILAGKSAFFQLAFSRIGLVPDGAVAWLLPRVIGLARTREMVLLAERVSAEKALNWGLINQMHADAELMPAALSLAQELAARPAATIPSIRRVYWDGLDNSYEAQLELEAKLQGVAGKTEDYAEGVTAFREKRQPVFKGG